MRISIHAPLTGSDTPERRVRDRTENFNPRSPHRERRAPRRGWCEPIPHFNPRSPHRERRLLRIRKLQKWNFNPRSPHRERRMAYWLSELALSISIHAPLTGSDCAQRITISQFKNFNPRSPRRERQCLVLAI